MDANNTTNKNTAKANTANKLNREARALVRQWIVQGLTNGQLRAGLQQRGFPSDLTDATFTEYRQDKQVVADIAVALHTVRVEGIASRIQRIKRLHKRLMQIDHRLDGTTPLPDNPDVADAQAQNMEVDNATFKQLAETELKMLTEMSRLVDEPVKATATITSKDAQGQVTGTTTVLAETTDPRLREIGIMAQTNDALEDVLNMLEQQEAAATLANRATSALTATGAAALTETGTTALEGAATSVTADAGALTEKEGMR